MQSHSGIKHVNVLAELIDFFFPKEDMFDFDLTARRAILSTLNANVHEINDILLKSLGGHLLELRNADSVDKKNDVSMVVECSYIESGYGQG
jgi:hypothetical protein